MLTLNVTPQAADLIIASLRQLPHAQVHDLVMEIFNQVQQQQQADATAAQEEVAEVAAEDVKAGGTD